MGAGVLKGGVQATVGLPGDLEEWRRSVAGSPSARVLPTSKEVGEYLPQTGRDTKTWEAVGEQLNPVEELKPLVAFGGSPRASISLAQAARAHAFLRGRSYVVPEDVRALAPDVLRHRIVLTFEAEAEDLTTDDVVAKVIGAVGMP